MRPTHVPADVVPSSYDLCTVFVLLALGSVRRIMAS
ncbi:hypothetical protein J2S46_000725 [Kitasatospora herbaricolor]|nr:hypothetical protein [Kitasatospora herbaricolor]